MEFSELKKLLQKNFEKMTAGATHLFEVDLDKDELWNLYLDSFPEGSNEVYKNKREYDCSCCRSFVKSMGNVVAIKDNELITIWDFKTDDSVFQPVLNALSEFVKSKTISNVWFSQFGRIGTDKNFDISQDYNNIITWHHFCIDLPDKFVNKSGKSLGELKGSYRDTKNVLKRSLDEITEDSILTVLELVNQNSLYKGMEWRAALVEFLNLKRKYDTLQEFNKDNFAWEQSVKVGIGIGRIRNHSIGTLLVDISNGVDLDEAVRSYERIVAPENYKRPTAIFTAKMVEEAKKTIEELGYMDSLSRRYAKLDDISVNNILFANRDSVKRVIGGDIFGELTKDVSVDPKKYSKVEEVQIEDFVKNVLSTAKNIEVFLESKHAKNMVSLIAPQIKDSKSMFKWNNSFSWAYSGNMTDSKIRENVKNAGGNVNGVLRFSIQWNDGEYNPNDFDAHCIQPNGGHEIFYGMKNDYSTTGQLDVDIIYPDRSIAAVENITWTDKERMRKGTYKFFVHNFSNRGGRTGFKAEIEFEGQIYSFEYNKELKHKENVHVAEVHFDGRNFSITEKLPSSCSSREIWGLKSNQFIPVSVVMYSPNYWDEQKGIGNKHYFFMLNGCKNPERPNGFYNEFLKEELMKQKRVFEALGSKAAVEDSDDQLSGVGFSSTKRDELLVRVEGQSSRVVKIKF